MKTFPDLASAQAYAATLPAGTFEIDQNLDGTTDVTEGLTPPNPVPQEVTALQAKEAIAAAGLYNAVNTYMQTAPLSSQIAWAEATNFQRNDQFVLAAATALNLTPAQVDALFIAAAQINV